MKKICGCLLFFILFSCETKNNSERHNSSQLEPTRYNVAFLIMDGTFNTELTAPYDIFQHTIYRQGIKAMNVFKVANTLKPITKSDY